MMSMIDHGAVNMAIRLDESISGMTFKSGKAAKDFFCYALRWLASDREARDRFMQDPGLLIACASGEKNRPIMFVLHEKGASSHSIRMLMNKKYPELFAEWFSSPKALSQP